MEHTVVLTAQNKAFLINQDTSTYGSFGEIGAGQEVAHHFFRAGATSGTVAKTMSAYDMTFSDAIYGVEPSGRYVCENRLRKMLTHEYKLLETRLGELRGASTRFFCFANTMAARSRSVAKGRGWMGICFQEHPGAPVSELVLHVQLLDARNALQKEVVGILGVNLIYGALYLNQDPFNMVESLSDNLSTERVEVDMIRCSGPAFPEADNRALALHLVKKELSRGVLLDSGGAVGQEVLQPSEALFGQSVLLQHIEYEGGQIQSKLCSDEAYQRAVKSFEQFTEDKAYALASLSLADGFGESLHLESLLSFIDRMPVPVLVHNHRHLFNILKDVVISACGFVLSMEQFTRILNRLDHIGPLLAEREKEPSSQRRIYVYGSYFKKQEIKYPNLLKDLTRRECVVFLDK